MFDIGFDQAAGLRSDALGHGPSLMPLASPAQPALAYELLCKLATRLTAQGDPVVIIDATATESASEQRHDGSPLGLLRALQDPSVSGLERPADGGEWLVMPGARGMQALQLTAAAGGADAALSRLFAPFASSVTVLLFAPAFDLAGLLSGLSGRALVPVLGQPQASIDAYGAVKQLHAAGLSPVLAPMHSTDMPGQLPLDQVVRTVTECAQRHLGLTLDHWPEATWAQRVPVSTISRQHRPAALANLHRTPAFDGMGAVHHGAVQSLWS
ncbi:MAG: hypothetical protein CVU22_23320 [Betaproteobacteria bacterium HGW-Betaproteobacteria-16]|nr:MAG: hypothetical protein CVU22_23320 [Betaproteobacteria bacterium HGW-Betaproteobacteria-16]